MTPKSVKRLSKISNFSKIVIIFTQLMLKRKFCNNCKAISSLLCPENGIIKWGAKTLVHNSPKAFKNCQKHKHYNFSIQKFHRFRI